MKKTFFLIFIAFLLSCSEEKKETKILCSQEEPYGDCEDDTTYCFKGYCIPFGAKCEEDQIMAPCDNKSYTCKYDAENQLFFCDQLPCSKTAKEGYCPDGQVCHQNETTLVVSCTNLCSLENKNGLCLDETKSCWDGYCLAIDGRCSPQNKTGFCSTGKSCDEGFCSVNCSIENPTGYCISGKTCIDGVCTNDSELCSSVNQTGICPTGEVCSNGVCDFLCSESHKAGICIDASQLCSDGECKNICSLLDLNGVCLSDADKCINGSCISPCSDANPTGYCNNDMSCFNGNCYYECSTEHVDGYCSENHYCLQGECKAPCSQQNPTGFCTQEDYICFEGECILGCSPENRTGECLSQYEYCDYDTGDCEIYPCSSRNPTGPCLTDPNQQCVDGRCKYECSTQNSTGFCREAGYICVGGSCINPLTQPCSTQYPQGVCQEHYSCVNGSCIEADCSPEYPTGACPEGRVCDNGICILPNACIDNRPIGPDQGSCCLSDNDCVKASGAYEAFCITEDSSEGAYCIDVFARTMFTPNVGCNHDSECSDPYPQYGTEQQYYCNQLYYPTMGIEIDVRFCMKNLDNCSFTRAGDPGDACNVRCMDSECKFGNHCYHGICTRQCNLALGTFENRGCPQIDGKYLDCLIEGFDFDKLGKEYEINICSLTCNSNSDCALMEGTECKRLAKTDTGIKHFVCDNEHLSSEITPLGGYCEDDSVCATAICNKKDNICSTPCNDDADCGSNGFCYFDYGVKNSSTDSRYMQYFGICRYSDSSIGLGSSCSSDSNCSNGKVCIPKFTDNSVIGICGKLEKTTQTNRVNYKAKGESCNNTTDFCQNDLCIDGVCREYCESTATCGTNSICSKAEVRKSSIYQSVITNATLYAGSCKPFTGSMSICSNSINPCQNNEVCIYNTPKKVTQSSDIEYLCVAKKTGKNIGESCSEDSECQTHICHPTQNRCTVACSSNTQCEGFSQNRCNMNAAVVSDLESQTNIYAGVCE
ncbi:hypothetical protein JXR93_13225 [bacterium]|nr:hypothetical protein [bacterium]